jgi:ADP-heptose:LPS heptosyltransferase
MAAALKDHYGPEVEVHWYAHGMGKLVLSQHPWVDRVHYYPSSIWKSLLFLFGLRKLKFDVVIDAMANPRTALASRFTGAKTRISFATRWNRNWAYTHLVPQQKLVGGYVGKKRLNLLELLGIEAKSEGIPKLFPNVKETERAENWLRENGLWGKKWVAFSATHRHAVRKWPGQHFVELAKRLILENELQVVWLWGPGEREEVAALSKQLSEKSFVVPLFSLKETAALCSHAQFFVGNSNGLSHVAAAGGCKTVVLHGPTSPISWTPEDHLRHQGVQRNTGCIGCQSNKCALPRRECLEDLSVEEVFMIARKL